MYKIQQPEDQTQFCLPLNRDTEHLYYNTYLVIDANVLTEPRVWQISKINRSNSKGVVIFTCAQDLANQHTLKADYDEDGNVVAWWADWKEGVIEPTSIIEDNDTYSSVTSKIICSGRNQIKIGGSAKTFTINYYNYENEIIEDHPVGTWEFFIDGEDIPIDLLTLTYTGNKVKVKFLGDDTYIGKILTIKNTSGDITSTLDVELLPL